MKGLFGCDCTDRPLPKRQRAPRRRVDMAHAAAPGTGPECETCKTCRHYCRVHADKVYRKCGLTRATWSHGPGTDIRAMDLACEKWERPCQ